MALLPLMAVITLRNNVVSKIRILGSMMQNTFFQFYFTELLDRNA